MKNFRENIRDLYGNNYIRYSFVILILAILFYFPAFLDLNQLTLRIWDESRLAVNAFEMYKSGHYLIPCFKNVPDMWSTKPPLMIWLQVLFMHLFGVGELAVRLPSAISVFLVAFFIVWLSWRYLKSFWLGLFAALALLTSYGYMDLHAARTGDYDSLLSLWTTLNAFFIFLAIEKENKRGKYILLSFVFLTLGTLTKGIEAYMLLPGVFLYALFNKKVIVILKRKEFYFGIGILLLLGISYYFIREIYNPGYLKAVWNNELWGRFGTVVENHQGPFDYYFHNFTHYQFTYWMYFIPLGLLLGFLSRDNKVRKLTLFCLLTFGMYFIAVSSAKTKLQWYDVPMYPFLAVLIGIFLNELIVLSHRRLSFRPFVKKALPFIILIVVYLYPYGKSILLNYKRTEYSRALELCKVSYLLRREIKGTAQHNLEGFKLLKNGYEANNYFYLVQLQDDGMNIHFADYKHLKTGEKVLVYNKTISKFVKKHYKISQLWADPTTYPYNEKSTVYAYVVEGKK